MIILDQQNIFEYVIILAGKLEIFLIHSNKSDFRTFSLLYRITKIISLLNNINDNGDNNKKTKNLKAHVRIPKNMGGNIPSGNFPGGSFPDIVLNMCWHKINIS